jgi:gluconokinase
MLIILFGRAGTGKNFVGNILANHFGFYFWDADEALPKNMQQAIMQHRVFTEPMRAEFARIIIDNIEKLQLKYPKIVVAQALYKEKNRAVIKQKFPHAIFIKIEADDKYIEQRLTKRLGGIDMHYARLINDNFEQPHLPCLTLLNNRGSVEVISALRQYWISNIQAAEFEQKKSLF